MNRRTFLGALVAALAAPSLFRKLLRPEPFPWKAGPPVEGGRFSFLRSRKLPPNSEWSPQPELVKKFTLQDRALRYEEMPHGLIELTSGEPVWTAGYPEGGWEAL